MGLAVAAHLRPHCAVVWWVAAHSVAAMAASLVALHEALGERVPFASCSARWVGGGMR